MYILKRIPGFICIYQAASSTREATPDCMLCMSAIAPTSTWRHLRLRTPEAFHRVREGLGTRLSWHMVVMHGMKCFTSWSARKMLLTTLGVVLTLSVMWICRPSARSMSVELQSTLTTKKLTARKRKTININRQLLQNNYYSQMNITFDRILLSELDSSSDVYVSMRSTALFHKSRLFLLLHTWLQTIDPKQVYLWGGPA